MTFNIPSTAHTVFIERVEQDSYKVILNGREDTAVVYPSTEEPMVIRCECSMVFLKNVCWNNVTFAGETLVFVCDQTNIDFLDLRGCVHLLSLHDSRIRFLQHRGSKMTKDEASSVNHHEAV